MSNPSNSASSRPSRSGLERSLNYGGLGLRRFQKLLLNAYLFFAFCGAAAILSAVVFGSEQLAAIGLCVVVFFGPPLFFGWMSLREMEMKRIDVNDAGLIVDDGKKREDFQFAEMSDVSFEWVPFLVFKVHFAMTDGRKLTLPSTVERLDYPLDLLSNARPDLTSELSFLHYRRIAISLDHVWARIGSSLANPVKTAIAALGRLAFTIICTVGITSLGQQMKWFPQIDHFSSFVLWSLNVLAMSVFVWLTSYAVYEVRFFLASIRRLKDDPYAVKRDIAHETEVLKKTIGWTYAGSFGMAILVAYLAAGEIGQHEAHYKTQTVKTDGSISESSQNRVPASADNAVRADR